MNWILFCQPSTQQEELWRGTCVVGAFRRMTDKHYPCFLALLRWPPQRRIIWPTPCPDRALMSSKRFHVFLCISVDLHRKDEAQIGRKECIQRHSCLKQKSCPVTNLFTLSHSLPFVGTILSHLYNSDSNAYASAHMHTHISFCNFWSHS